MIRLVNRTVAALPALKMLGIALLTIVLAYLGAWYIGVSGMPAFISLISLAIAGTLGVAILFWPHIGLVFLVASLPISAALPTLPLVTTMSIPLGAATVAGYVIQRRWGNERGLFRLQPIHVLAVAFVLWLFISNPTAALLGDERNWILTFAQLGILLFLTGILMQPIPRQRQMLFFFCLAAVFSALFALAESPLLQAPTVVIREQRAGGLAGINSAARYFVVALVALPYLYATVKGRGLRLMAIAALFILILGVIATGSRSGLLLLPFALVLVLAGRRSQKLIGRMALFLFVAALILVAIPQSIWQILEDSVNLTTAGIESEDIRFELWRAGVAMWREQPVTGVGVGQFPANLPAHALGRIPTERLNAGPHSIYIAVLAEAGVVGFLLFMALCGASLYALWHAYTRLPREEAALAYTWMAMLLIMLIGGLTKHDQYEKLVWVLFGMAVVYNQRLTSLRLDNGESAVDQEASG